MKHESELAGVAGELTPEEASALADATMHPVLRRLLEIRLDPPQPPEDPQPRCE